jgi:two-component system response regulator AtoC
MQNLVTPHALLFSTAKAPAQLVRMGVHLRRFVAEEVRELDAATTHWVYFVPAAVLEKAEWSGLRVELAQANRWFIVYGSGCASAAIVRAMRDGAFDFVDTREPLTRWSEATEKAVTSQQLWLQLYGDRSGPGSGGTGLVGKSEAMQSLVRTIGRIGPTAANVLIIGESGTGKEKAAQALHEASGLGGPFVPVNCAAIPRDLIESELFGAEKGAFTGALHARQGLVEQAAGGTLFLDEIGELDVALQPKLLRFLESRRARRVGGRTEYKVDARILAATNRDLEVQIEKNEFRADLFYRLSEIVIKIPPLRMHAEDLPLLALHFLNEANEKFGKNFVSIDPALIAAMTKHSWPGNARELRGSVHRMVVLHHGPILRAEWWENPVTAAAAARRDAAAANGPAAMAVQAAAPGILNRRQRFERARDLLRESGNDQSWTAAQLGIHPTTLFRWVKAGKV